MYKKIFFFLIFLYFKQLFCQKEQMIYQCGADKYSSKPKVLENFKNNGYKELNGRRTESTKCETFKKFNIYNIFLYYFTNILF